ncbi:hypothetical protein HGO37_23495 [Rhizobium sp. CG4]|jgi:hypothetical protein|uniref:hypothetical protein n=1 Tax=Rhizobium/Agrobacterium group TaxID=227290 RepID=UPI00178710B8|nr:MULTISPECIES: hypothetical protein [Rhizobium/Agrobacterium group]MBD9389996.1 hypothetical protein [Agrobacterium sp. AGB01]MCM2458363.1 hypothetical protein [Rhizobium sp. CG4]MCS4242413.1 hypothetical protein [Rhizobium sp. BIGb0125]MDO5895851.1 hypothetical protein [Agrobacterium sp. Azo12]
MFIKGKQSTSTKIGAISTAWMVLVFTMLATTFTLYEQQIEKQGPEFPQVSSRYQYMNYY